MRFFWSLVILLTLSSCSVQLRTVLSDKPETPPEKTVIVFLEDELSERFSTKLARGMRKHGLEGKELHFSRVQKPLQGTIDSTVQADIQSAVDSENAQVMILMIPVEVKKVLGKTIDVRYDIIAVRLEDDQEIWVGGLDIDGSLSGIPMKMAGRRLVYAFVLGRLL